MKIRLKVLLALIVLIVLIAVLIMFVRQSGSMRLLTVNYKNATDIIIKPLATDHPHEHKEEQEAVRVYESGQEVSLDKNKYYILSYKGFEGFEGGEIDLPNMDEDQKINIDPYFSKSRLEAELNTEVDSIHKTIIAAYKNIGLYEIQKGELYRFGEWYGTTLKYIGSDYFNADTLRLLMYKKNGVWQIETHPDIYLSKFSYPAIPEDVLRKINAAPQPEGIIWKL